MQAQALSEYQARRARLGFKLPPKAFPSPAKALPKASVYAEPIGPVCAWRTVYDEPSGPPRITSPNKRAQFILDGMARFYKVTVDEIKSERRGREVIQPRHEAMALIRESTPWSLPKIGKFFGGRDHTTVLSAIRRHQARIDAGTVGP